MLDRDGLITSSEVFCSGCENTHDSSLFSRRCLGGAGVVWGCPHRSLDYERVTGIVEGRDGHRCEQSFLSVRNGIRCSFVTLRGRYITHWPFMRASPNYVPSDERVKEALGPPNTPMCPHLRLNDACVATAYSQDCRRLQWNLWKKGPALWFQKRFCIDPPFHQ